MMKKNDFAVMLAVAIFAVVLSLVLSNLIFAPKSKTLKAQKIDLINSDFTQPDKKYFNDQGINPTQLIQIGDSANAKPF